MAYIYKITNDINQKIYIGKTEFSVEKRFKEHCKDAFKECTEKRPLYAAMRKYGIEHFYIELIEETDNPEEREIYWIEHYGSFKNGYNATKGGDGKSYLDHDLIIATYKETKSLTKTKELLGHDTHSISHVLKQHNIEVASQEDVNRQKYGKIIKQLDLNGNLIAIHSSINEAARAIGKENCHISACVNGKRKSAYGYRWEKCE